MAFPVDLKFIKDTEVKLGVVFPASFKLRMSKLNGGDLRTVVHGWEEHWLLHPFFDTSDRKRHCGRCTFRGLPSR